MDSYGTKFRLFASASDFATDGRGDCEWDESTQLFRLAVNQRPHIAQADPGTAMLQWQAARPLVADHFGQLGFLSEDRSQLQYALSYEGIDSAGVVLASSESTVGGTAAELSLDPVNAPGGNAFTDLHLGGDGRIALPYSDGATRHGLLVVHLARRWQRSLMLTNRPTRVWVDYLNRIWLAGDTWFGLYSGEPLPQDYIPQPGRFEPLVINPHPLAEQWRRPLPVDLRLMAMTADEDYLYLLVLFEPTQSQRLLVRPLADDQNLAFERWDLELILDLDEQPLPLITDIAALSPRRLALMVAPDPAAPHTRDIPVLDLPVEGTARLLRRRCPQHSQKSVRFVTGKENTGPQQGSGDHNSGNIRVHYLSEQGPKPLHRLPQARFMSEGAAGLSRTLDSGDYNTVWHRVYLDACIPPGCKLSVEVKAFDDTRAEGEDWQLQAAPGWQPIRSELAFYDGRFAPEKPHQGLFEVLLQRSTGVVRQIRGRYLKLRLTMQGDGRHSPAIACMRVYFPRFCWQQNYLPEHFHQQQALSALPAPANGADLRERLLASFEGMMTPIETGIASAECWLYPMATPARRLPRLAASIGAELPVHWPLVRKRRWLAAQGELQRRKGSFAGLCLALDIATDGALSLGRVVPVENYRLRRTLATILGIDMNDDDHPLTLGTGQSGNSIVGESLILSDEEAQQFLALFAPELAETAQQRATLEAFFDRYAHRLSVLVHSDARPLRNTIEKLLQQQVPAHIEWKIIETDHPFVPGLSPLLGIDTYLEKQPPWRQVVLGDTYLGREGIMRNHPALSPDSLRFGDKP